MTEQLIQYIWLFTVVVFLCAFLIFFILRHVKPLTAEEIQQLAGSRRKKEIKEYYTFDKDAYYADPSVKSKMKADGKYYDMQKNLFEFPSYAAALLKYKKHEWIIVGFCRDKQVLKMWINKGDDNMSVSLFIEIEEMIRSTEEVFGNSILFFHNHPNSNPSSYSCKMPSEQDLKMSSGRSTCLKKEGINLIEFICERGFHHQYCFSIADQFMPLSIFADNIAPLNGETKWRNFTLHLERLEIF